MGVAPRACALLLTAAAASACSAALDGAPTILDVVRYHQQPVASNDPGPFTDREAPHEDWCNAASAYMVLHAFIPDLPAQLQAVWPDFRSWRGEALPDDDDSFYDPRTTYAIEEALQRETLGRVAHEGGLSFAHVQAIVAGVSRDVGVSLSPRYFRRDRLVDALADGGLAIVNNQEWGGHYFVIARAERIVDRAGGDARYWILDPTNIENHEGALLDHLDAERTASFRAALRARQPCGSARCESARLGIYVLDEVGLAEIWKGTQRPGDAALVITPDGG